MLTKYLTNTFHLRNTMLADINTHNATLIVVSKTQTVANMHAVYERGHKHFGENYLQEALTKIPQLPQDITWHFIGPIQSNKCKDIATHFDWIHSIDRIKVAQKLNTFAPKKLNVLIQLNIDNEESKSGVQLSQLDDLITQIQALKNLELMGFMCIPDKTNPNSAFQKMNELQHTYGVKHLSMGMSGDYKLAIKHGSTMVRIGTAIFGKRKNIASGV